MISMQVFTVFVFVPLSFAYIIPMQRRGVITAEMRSIPQRDWAVMGMLDGVAGIMATFGTGMLSDQVRMPLTAHKELRRQALVR